MLRGHVEGNGFMSVSKTRSSWLCKTSQTEKNPNTWHLPYTEKKKSSKKSKKQEAFQKSHETVVPSSHLCLMDFVSQHIYFRSPMQLSSLTHCPAVSATTGLSLSRQGLRAFSCSPVTNKALTRSTLFSCTAAFLVPLDKCPNIQTFSCDTITSACRSQPLTWSRGPEPSLSRTNIAQRTENTEAERMFPKR